MNRRDFLKTLGMGSAHLAGSGLIFSSFFPTREYRHYPVGHDKTNIILINVDDLGWMDLSCYGSRYYETPNIDLLAAQGMRFTDAYASCAVCSPTRASIMTGRYPARIGITDWIHHLDRQVLATHRRHKRLLSLGSAALYPWAGAKVSAGNPGGCRQESPLTG